eukprot:CAMPEP_0114624570 /NCGR_PEP_ID=MMETSP0168-20121206/10832_1 /TAXON_ID=95228 ORGANISM="Vannella sp., Strain DIVA3 517/6/12" /NCGR_SAMPLE_ID=MMETSP0168 /ASSEMBLY_ACC=CAM_ASM_000044 /LENGTH=64 /DNA_ID=CAMNT_0001835843 /DNA_START=1 /DNA_END=195 /DNA_ORIENTATION=-
MMTYGVTIGLGVYVGVRTFGEVFNPDLVPLEHRQNALLAPSTPLQSESEPSAPRRQEIEVEDDD